LNSRDDPIYAGVIDIEMGHQSQRRILLTDQDSTFLQMHTQRFQVAIPRLDKHHVGETLDRQTLDAADTIGQLPCPFMVVGVSRDIVVERIQAASGYPASLAHPAAEHFT